MKTWAFLSILLVLGPRLVVVDARASADVVDVSDAESDVPEADAEVYGHVEVGLTCSKGCRCGNSCIDCSKRCHKGSAGCGG